MAKSPPTEAARELCALLGLRMGGNGHAFMNYYETKGLYAYSAGPYAGIAYFGLGGSVAQLNARATGLHQYRPKAPTPRESSSGLKAVDGPRTAVRGAHAATEAEARRLCALLGLREGGAGYTFVGDYPTKGLYAYRSGPFASIAFFGIGGGDEDAMAPVSEPDQFRPALPDISARSKPSLGECGGGDLQMTRRGTKRPLDMTHGAAPDDSFLDDLQNFFDLDPHHSHPGVPANKTSALALPCLEPVQKAPRLTTMSVAAHAPLAPIGLVSAPPLSLSMPLAAVPPMGHALPTQCYQQALAEAPVHTQRVHAQTAAARTRSNDCKQQQKQRKMTKEESKAKHRMVERSRTRRLNQIIANLKAEVEATGTAVRKDKASIMEAAVLCIRSMRAEQVSLRERLKLSEMRERAFLISQGLLGPTAS